MQIPVIGNGNIIDVQSAKRMFEYTNCDGIMIARAAQGNPWIFEQITEGLQKGKIIEKPNLEDIKQMIIRHLNMLAEYKNEKIAVLEMLKNIAWYLKGMPNSSFIRNEINKIEDFQELLNKINSL